MGVNRFWKSIDFFFPGKGRLYLSLYISVLLHFVFLVYFFNSGADWENKMMVCGPPWIYPPESQLAQKDKSLSLSFGEEEGDSENDGEEEGDGEGGGGFEENPDFDKDKFKDGKWKDLVDRLEESSQLRKNFKNNFEGVVRDGNVDDSYIFRKRDYEDITVKEVFPTVHNIDKPFAEEVQKAPEELSVHKERNRIIDLYRNLTKDADLNYVELEGDREKRSKSPLEMPREDRMQYLDRNLPRKKEAQMDDFISRFMNYDPDTGDLPVFIRDLYYENLQRLAYTFSSDPTYFTIDYFQENLNKEDFLKNSLALYSEMQDKKAGTEILFTLENIYEIQSRALNLYFQNKKSFPLLSEESRKELRVEVIRRVLERYQPILEEKNISSSEDVNRLYTEKRLDIMDNLIRNTPDGYRVADAKFEKARIHWEYAGTLSNEKKYEEEKKAIQIWKSIQETDRANGDFLNEKSWNEIRDILQKSPQLGENMNFNARNRINMAIRMRLNEALKQKKIREDRLLWKKKKESD